MSICAGARSSGIGFSLAATLLLAGCAGADRMREVPLTAGSQVSFQAPNEYVRRAAREALLHAKYEITEEKQVDENTYTVLGLMGVGWQSNGQWGRVVVRKLSESESRAWIHTMKRIEMNITENIDITRTAVQKYMLELVELYKEDDKAAARRQGR